MIWSTSTTTTYSTISPVNDNTLSIGKSGKRWSNVYSTDGDFSGTVTTDTIDNAWYKSGGANMFLTNVNGIQAYQQIVPIAGGTLTVGLTTRRFGGIHGVDGSFSGSLVSEAGGSYKLYNLGIEGDADTEYLEISATSNIFSIYSKATGTGVVREVTIGNPDNRFRSSSTGVIFTAGGSTRLNITSNFTYLGSAVAVLPDSDGTIELGRDAARWQNVASVDGDFSGNLSADMEGFVLNLEGEEGDTDRVYLQSTGGADSSTGQVSIWSRLHTEGAYLNTGAFQAQYRIGINGSWNVLFDNVGFFVQENGSLRGGFWDRTYEGNSKTFFGVSYDLGYESMRWVNTFFRQHQFHRCYPWRSRRLI